MRYAFFDQQGRVESAHNDDTVLELPDGAAELSEAQWDDRFNLRLASGVLVHDPVVHPIADIKAKAWDRIKAKRDAVSVGGVKVGTKWYHTDETSRAKYLGLVRMADAAVAAGGAATATLQYGGQDIQWKTMDGSFIKMTVQRANDVFNAVSGFDFTVFAAAETHRVAMEASADPSAYDFANGWPATFGG